MPSLKVISTSLLLAIAHLTHAYPQADTTSSASPTAATITPPDRYRLKTKVTYGGDVSKNGLYVISYHTGAGLNDAVLTAANGSIGFLNGSYQQFDFQTDFPWSLNLLGHTNYAAWDDVQLNVGQNTQGFFFNETGLQFGIDGAFASDQFGGWIACDWYHDTPQLFFKYAFYDATLPCSCSLVELYAEEVTAAENNTDSTAFSTKWFMEKRAKQPDDKPKGASSASSSESSRVSSSAPSSTPTKAKFGTNWFLHKRAIASAAKASSTPTKPPYKGNWFVKRATVTKPSSTPTDTPFDGDWFKKVSTSSSTPTKAAFKGNWFVKRASTSASSIPTDAYFSEDWFKKSTPKSTTPAPSTPTKVSFKGNWFVKRATTSTKPTSTSTKTPYKGNWFVKRAPTTSTSLTTITTWPHGSTTTKKPVNANWFVKRASQVAGKPASVTACVPTSTATKKPFNGDWF